jgi:hypothetical protein
VSVFVRNLGLAHIARDFAAHKITVHLVLLPTTAPAVLTVLQGNQLLDMTDANLRQKMGFSKYAFLACCASCHRGLGATCSKFGRPLPS